jgi:hypothetical protein
MLNLKFEQLDQLSVPVWDNCRAQRTGQTLESRRQPFNCLKKLVDSLTSDGKIGWLRLVNKIIDKFNTGINQSQLIDQLVGDSRNGSTSHRHRRSRPS